MSDKEKAQVQARLVGRRLRAARQRLADVTEEAREAAVAGAAAGVSQVELARALGVDRARTLRRWLDESRG